MKRILGIATVMAFLLMSAAASGSSAHYSDCGPLKGSHTGRYQAGAGTSCLFARAVDNRVILLTQLAENPFSGLVTVDGVTMECHFYKTGHVVYLCSGDHRQVRLYAGVRD